MAATHVITRIVIDYEITQYGDIEPDTGQPLVVATRNGKLGFNEADIPKDIRTWIASKLGG